MVKKTEIVQFQRKILTWYEANKRDLPWRGTRDPYRILVSEIMSQQTQIARVIPKYNAWMEAFPTVFELAKASTADVLGHWSGLGYNRRALFLQKCAKTVVERFAGKFPQEKEVLKTLPGIGEYTAAAVACFAFNQQVAVVDTNVRKIILTQFPHVSSDISPQEMQNIADALLPQGKAYEWNQALMDYASAMLKKEKIVVPKQSKFKGSNRYYRGQIVKLLLAQKSIARAQLAKELSISKEKCAEILGGLEKDALVVRSGEYMSLSN